MSETGTDESSESSDSGESSEDLELTKEQAMGDEDIPQEKKDAIEEERQRRLDPDNRPENAEVDNSDREFDVEAGAFTDSEHHDDDSGPYNDPTSEDGDAEA